MDDHNNHSDSGQDFKTQQRHVLNIYALFTVTLILMFLPFVTAAMMAMIMFIASLVAAYVIRHKRGPGSYAGDHMTYIIRTIWILALFTFITMAAALIYVLPAFDPAPVQACAQQVIDAAGATADPAALQKLMQPCMDEFMAANRRVFMIGGAIAILPVTLYYIFRLSKGLSRALKGHRIGNVKNWF